ncbi:MAG: ferritin-like protein [Actinomycetota bacterium]
MLKIRREVMKAVGAASDPAELHQWLQSAIELEHATIPTYLTALYSIKPAYNEAARQVLRSVVIEEMLHMTIAANLLNALGGSPRMDRPGFIPTFPGPLPMGIAGDLTVSLRKLTRGQVVNVFMVIEEPEEPLDLVVKQPSTEMFRAQAQALPPAAQREFGTIGEFYEAISNKIAGFGDGAFTGDPNRQVVDDRWFASDELFAIQDVKTAQKGIGIIVEQGEGTTTSPEDPEMVPAHYYRFAEIVYGRRLVRDPSAPGGQPWSFSGAPVGLNPAGVWNLYPDAKSVDYPGGSRARYLSDQFNSSYTNLLRCLEETFNGSPENLKVALGIMIEMRLIAQELVATAVPGTEMFCAPTFEYTPVL